MGEQLPTLNEQQGRLALDVGNNLEGGERPFARSPFFFESAENRAMSTEPDDEYDSGLDEALVRAEMPGTRQHYVAIGGMYVHYVLTVALSILIPMWGAIRCYGVTGSILRALGILVLYGVGYWFAWFLFGGIVLLWVSNGVVFASLPVRWLVLRIKGNDPCDE